MYLVTAITDFELCGWTIICARPFSCVCIMFPLARDKNLLGSQWGEPGTITNSAHDCVGPSLTKPIPLCEIGWSSWEHFPPGNFWNQFQVFQDCIWWPLGLVSRPDPFRKNREGSGHETTLGPLATNTKTNTLWQEIPYNSTMSGKIIQQKLWGTKLHWK